MKMFKIFCNPKNFHIIKKNNNRLIEELIFDIFRKKIIPTVIVDYKRSHLIILMVNILD